MRLDKFLKVSRLIKRRTVAKEVCDNDRIFLNSKIAKPSSEVKVGDIITINMGERKLVARILNIQTSSKKEESQSMYEII